MRLQIGNGGIRIGRVVNAGSDPCFQHCERSLKPDARERNPGFRGQPGYRLAFAGPRVNRIDDERSPLSQCQPCAILQFGIDRRAC